MRNGRTRDEMPHVRRKYLSPDEARRVIEAAGKVGRQPDRDKLLLTMRSATGCACRRRSICDGQTSTWRASNAPYSSDD